MSNYANLVEAITIAPSHAMTDLTSFLRDYLEKELARYPELQKEMIENGLHEWADSRRHSHVVNDNCKSNAFRKSVKPVALLAQSTIAS